MIRATFTGATIAAAGSDTAGRRIAGIAVPWDVSGRVSDGTSVIFHAGSLDAAARPVALRDHDRTRPVGKVTAATDTGRQLEAVVAVSRVALGDESLVLAADGALMFSVGAEPTDYTFDDAGVLHVHAADWQELSLLPLGAYPAAVVTHVAAALPDKDTNMTITDTELLEAITDAATPEEPDVPAEGDDDGDETPEEAKVPAVPISAARGGRRTSRPYEHVTLAQVSRLVMAARGGDPTQTALLGRVLAAQGAAVRGIEAALTDVKLVGTDNVAAMYRPAYQAELVDIISWGTPTIDVLRQGDLERGDYPNKTFNSWTKKPTVALQATEKAAINSTAVSITPTSVPVQTWAGGNDLSRQLLDFGSPSFVEDYIRAAGADYALKSNTYATQTLLGAAANVASLVGDSFIQVLGKLFGALSPATTPPGGMFCAVSQDVGISLVGVPKDQGPAFWDGHVNFGKMTAEVTNDAGLLVYVDPTLPSRTYLGGHRDGATWYDIPGTPFNLQAVNVGLLGLDVAVYGYGALGIQYPGSFVKTQQPLS